MPYNVTDTMVALQNHLMKSAEFGEVRIGEPKAPPMSAKLTAAIMMQTNQVVKLFVNGGTDELRVLLVRFYANGFSENPDEVEQELARVESELRADFIGDSDLETSGIMTLDVGGIHGQPLRSDWGHVDVSGKLYRIVDMTVPLVIHDSATVG
jgi:hypothetical protein